KQHPNHTRATTDVRQSAILGDTPTDRRCNRPDTPTGVKLVRDRAGQTSDRCATLPPMEPSGIGFVGCEQTSKTPGAPAARRREVVVGGRRVKTIDVHAHCAVPEAMALMGRSLDTGQLLMTSPSERLRAMDEQGIDVEALSINPYWYTAGRDVARKLVAIQNAKLAEACAAHPDRFVAFASVALQHPDLAAEQLEEGM